MYFKYNLICLIEFLFIFNFVYSIECFLIAEYHLVIKYEMDGTLGRHIIM